MKKFLMVYTVDKCVLDQWKDRRKNVGIIPCSNNVFTRLIKSGMN